MLSLQELKANLLEVKANVIKTQVYVKGVKVAKIVAATAVELAKATKLSFDIAALEQRKAELDELFSNYRIAEIDLSDIEDLDADKIAAVIAQQIKKEVEQVEVEK